VRHDVMHSRFAFIFCQNCGLEGPSGQLVNYQEISRDVKRVYPKYKKHAC